ncbi:MAG: hypothetical protein ACOC2W_01015 [bacterium]
MTDLTNKVDNMDSDELNSLFEKYSEPLSVLVDENEKKYMAYIINACVDHIKNNYENVDRYKKKWSVVAVRRLYLNDYIDSDDAIKEAINLFMKYWDENRDNFVKNNRSSYKSDYLCDSGFVYEFIEYVKKEMQ